MIPCEWPFWTPGAWLANAMKRTTRHCYIYLTYKQWDSCLQRRRFFFFLISLCLWELVISLDPRGLIGRTFVGDHMTLLHTKYISYGPHGFREDF